MLYINPIYHSIQSRLFSRFIITCTVKPDNETHNQLTYTCNVSANPSITSETNQICR